MNLVNWVKQVNNFIGNYQARIEDILRCCLPSAEQAPKKLHAAMRYAMLNGGKRIRPLLVYASGLAFGADAEALDIAAAAIEFVHCYSLVHDDLPMMDNDALRRGKPTCHTVFDEATAILAGNALQARAFALLAGDEHNDERRRLAMVMQLADACSSEGMVGGQVMDLAATGKTLSTLELAQIHRMKTGALITASVRFGSIVAGVNDEVMRHLDEFSSHIGIAFQIQDDILDVVGDTVCLGKEAGADQNLQKVTYPALLGMQQAKQVMQQAYTVAIAALKKLPQQTSHLSELVTYIMQRDH